MWLACVNEVRRGRVSRAKDGSVSSPVHPAKLVASARAAFVPVDPAAQVHVRVFTPSPREQIA